MHLCCLHVSAGSSSQDCQTEPKHAPDSLRWKNEVLRNQRQQYAFSMLLSIRDDLKAELLLCLSYIVSYARFNTSIGTEPLS